MTFSTRPRSTAVPARIAVLGLVVLALARSAVALDVISTSPSPYALHVSPATTQITVTFDDVPLSPGPGGVRVFGAMSGLHPANWSVNGATLTIGVTGDWMSGELVSVNIRNDVQTAGGDFLTDGHYFAFTIASGPGPVSWSEPTVFGASVVPYFIYGGDIDGDGDPDVVAPNEGTDDISVFENVDGMGGFSSRTEYGVGDVPSSCYGDDFNNDGHVDIATADIASATLSVLLNQGDGTFGPRSFRSGGNTTRQVYGGDFDGDNDVDLVVTSKGTDQLFFYTNDGTGSFGNGVAYNDVGNGPFAVEAADFDLDGLLDLAVACHDADSLNILTNQGGGTFATTFRRNIGDGAWDLAGNDMDADGDFDLVVVCAFNNRLQLLENNGDGTFGKIGWTTDFFPLGVHTADVEGDGDIDAISSNFNGGSIDVFVNNGDGVLFPNANLNVDRTGSFAWAHDLDADGDLDISVVDELADSLFVFYNGSSPAVSAPNVAGPGGARAFVTAQPNPALASRGTDLKVVGLTGTATVEIHAVTGRVVRRLETTLSGGDVVRWDGRGRDGAPLPAGTYVVSVRAGDSRVSGRVQLVR